MSLLDRIAQAVDATAPSGAFLVHNPTGVWHRMSGAEPILWSLTVAAMFSDVTLTAIGLQLGLAELNPIARHILEAASVLGLYALKLLALGIGVGCRPLLPDRHTAFIPLALLLPSLGAVLINTTLIAVVVV